MDEHENRGVLSRLRSAFNARRMLAVVFFGAMGEPTNPHRVFLPEARSGLRLLHMAGTSAEADLLRQVLSGAGFQMEYVPTSSVGVFGTTGSNRVYVRAEEFDEAEAFLKAYLEAPDQQE